MSIIRYNKNGDNMKIAGIIVEYNPLHNGHLHHIEETRKLSNCDVLIAVMSSNFMQRGEPAIIDKFARTKMALNNHVDLVIELPFVFSVQNADIFALTSVSILNTLGVTDVYFGSESNNITPLEEIADVLESDEYNNLVKTYSKQGNSYPTSSALAMKDLNATTEYNKPNNILGIQYIKAVRTLKSDITMHTIQRINSDYYAELDQKSTIQSATAIRKELMNQNQIDQYVPKNVLTLLNNRKLVHIDDFTEYLRYILSSTTKEALHSIFGVEEGIENRILKIKEFTSTSDLINQLLTRRYTNSKIRRTLIHILCNTPKSVVTEFQIPYIRILGMNDIGKSYLSTIKKDFPIPIISKVKEGIHPYLDLELKASKVYSLVSNKDIFKEEFQPLIYLRFD